MANQKGKLTFTAEIDVTAFKKCVRRLEAEMFLVYDLEFCELGTTLNILGIQVEGGDGEG